jgi:4-amino-4-deoxy-L-arabinose transferase-like glycosyltransferase
MEVGHAMNVKTQRWHRTLLSIFIAALLIRGVFILTLQDGFYLPDSGAYSTAAVNLTTDGEFGASYRRPPAYPVFLGGIYALFGEQILAVRIVQALIGAFLAVVIAIMGQRVGGEGVGALAGILWSIYPLGVFIAGLLYPVSLATMLLACAILCLLSNSSQDISPRRAVLGGVLLGLAALTKPIVLATSAAVTLWVMYWGRPRRLFLVSLLLFGLALSLAPWTVRNFYVYGRIVPIEPRVAQHLPSMGNTQESSQTNNKIETILRHPGKFATHFGKEFLHFWQLYPDRVSMSERNNREKAHQRDSRLVKKTIFDMSWTKLVSILSVGPLFCFAIIGTGVMSLQKEQRRALSLLYMVILSFAVGYSLFFTQMRYRIPIEPYVIILSAYGLKEMWDALARRSMSRITPYKGTIV